MKRLNLSTITDSAQLRLKSGSVEFWQTAAKEAIGFLAKSVVGESYQTSVPYRLYGCENTGTAPNYIISAGAVLYNGEIYEVKPNVFTTSGSNVPVLNISTINDPVLDPVTLTDSSTANVHKNSLITISAGASGSGIIDYDLFYKPKYKVLENSGRYRLLITRVDYNHIHIEGYFVITQDSVTGYQGYKTISDLGYVFADNKHIGNSGVFEWVDSSSVLQATPAVSVMFETFAANTDNRIKITSQSGNLPSSYTVTGTVSINNTFEIIP